MTNQDLINEYSILLQEMKRLSSTPEMMKYYNDMKKAEEWDIHDKKEMDGLRILLTIMRPLIESVDAASKATYAPFN